MNYKNSVKILFSNFEHVWKVMLYIMLLSILSIFLLYLTLSPLYKMLEDSGVVGEMAKVYTDFLSSLNVTDAASSIGLIVDNGLETLSESISNIWPTFIGVALIVGFLDFNLRNLVSMPICNSINYYMGSMNKRGLYASFLDTFGKNLKFQL